MITYLILHLPHFCHPIPVDVLILLALPSSRSSDSLTWWSKDQAQDWVNCPRFCTGSAPFPDADQFTWRAPNWCLAGLLHAKVKFCDSDSPAWLTMTDVSSSFMNVMMVILLAQSFHHLVTVESYIHNTIIIFLILKQCILIFTYWIQTSEFSAWASGGSSALIGDRVALSAHFNTWM